MTSWPSIDKKKFSLYRHFINQGKGWRCQEQLLMKKFTHKTYTISVLYKENRYCVMSNLSKNGYVIHRWITKEKLTKLW